MCVTVWCWLGGLVGFGEGAFSRSYDVRIVPVDCRPTCHSHCDNHSVAMAPTSSPYNLGQNFVIIRVALRRRIFPLVYDDCFRLLHNFFLDVRRFVSLRASQVLTQSISWDSRNNPLKRTDSVWTTNHDKDIKPHIVQGANEHMWRAWIHRYTDSLPTLDIPWALRSLVVILYLWVGRTAQRNFHITVLRDEKKLPKKQQQKHARFSPGPENDTNVSNPH